MILLFENFDKFHSRIRNLLPPMNRKSNHNYISYQLETEILPLQLFYLFNDKPNNFQSSQHLNITMKIYKAMISHVYKLTHLDDFNFSRSPFWYPVHAWKIQL